MRKNHIIYALLLLLALALCVPAIAAKKKVHTIGDSTMANQPESGQIRGWGQVFQQFFTDAIEVNNRGKSGSSSRSFYLEANYWPSVKKQIAEGDYVIIQFGHNDEKNGGTDGAALKEYYKSVGDDALAESTLYHGTIASTTYKEFLRKYVEETRALGATPILVSPICRRYFSGEKVTRRGQHDLGDSFDMLTENGLTKGNSVPESDNSYDYPYNMKQVAEEMNVPFIDITDLSRELYESYGDKKSAEILFTSSDGTHPSAIGATLIARLCAQQMQQMGILADCLNLTTDLSVYPASVDLGSSYKGQVLTKEFQVNGFDLQPTDGTVTIEASTGLEVSLDGKEFGKSLTLSYAGGNMTSTFVARCEFTSKGVINETLTVKNGEKTITVPVTGECVVLEGGTESQVYWRLEKNDEATVTGPLTSLGQSFSEMYVQRYANPNKATVWPEWTGFETSRKTQRNLIVGDAWPEGDIDEVSTRYIEFAMTPAKDMTFHVDSISMFACGAGGSGMCCKIYYSKEENFANPVIFADYMASALPSNNPVYIVAQPVLSVESGETLRLRVYPWYNRAATGKTICLSDVTIHGMVMSSADGVAGVSGEDLQPVSTQYYNAAGMLLSARQSGMNIVRVEYSDGSVRTAKVAY